MSNGKNGCTVHCGSNNYVFNIVDSVLWDIDNAFCFKEKDT